MNDTVKPLLQPTPPAGEEQRVADVLNGIQTHLGFVPDGLRLYGISPDMLEVFVGTVGYFMGQQRLRQELLAMIRYLGSDRIGCSFCIDLNEARLLDMGLEPEQLQAARTDPEKAPLPDNEKALLRLALKAVATPEEVDASDLDAARDHGWSDRDIFEVVVMAANNRAFNLVLKSFNIKHQGDFG